jgi:SAM-dependent methyltransferase
MQKTQPKTWYEDSSFWNTFAPVMFTKEKLEGTTGEIDRLITLMDIKKDAKILDLCCGTGRHSLELARRGYDVVGVDITKEYLEIARKQAHSEGLNINFVRNDMRRFCQIEAFDAVINMYTAFGYFEDIADDKRVLDNVYCSLRKGGKMLIDIIGKEIVAKNFIEREWHKSNDNIFLRESKISRNWSWCENKWMMLENGKLREFEFGHRLYSAAELIAFLKDCGFGPVNIYGDLAGADYDHNANRLIAIAEKR